VLNISLLDFEMADNHLIYAQNLQEITPKTLNISLLDSEIATSRFPPQKYRNMLQKYLTDV